MSISQKKQWQARSAVVFLLAGSLAMQAQQPPEPMDRTPQDGQEYALMNQASGLQLSNGGGRDTMTAARDLTSLAQRWGLVRLLDGSWKLANSVSGECLTENAFERVSSEPCSLSLLQNWRIHEGVNGYSSLSNVASGKLLASYGDGVDLRTATGEARNTELWQLRPAFWRGADIAEQEKMEAIRVKTGLPWWKDADKPKDILKILKDHGFNSIRLRPTSIPPYYPDQSTNVCTGNFCYIETDVQELDLARRARDLGFSLELTLFFDGGSSQSIPGSWAGETQEQLAASIYNYTKAEIEMYRQAGLMPDMVSIGNEVDNGFLGGPGYYPYNHFAAFAAIEKAGLTAVADAAADTSIGAALPAPLTCIHITPQYDMTSFFKSANANGLNYDVICQSYYPIYHGPLTQAQADETNPSSKPVEATTLLTAAQTIKKPIYILETGEHYENGFDSNDPWYQPTVPQQRQFLLDFESVLHSLPNNLALGIEYWAPNDVEMPDGGGPYSTFQKDYTTPNAIFAWEGLGLFDSADPNYLTDPSAPNYSTALPGLDAVGGKLDATYRYKLTNRALPALLEGTGAEVGVLPKSLLTLLDGAVNTHSQWKIASDNKGAFTLSNIHASEGSPVVLDGIDPQSAQSKPFVSERAADGTTGQSWDIQTAGGGFYYCVNQATGLVLSLDEKGRAIEVARDAAGSQGQWAITQVAISKGN
jgi:arabinogalactan endo-1,4-beta-galactosidase